MDEQNLNYDLANIFAPQLAAQTQALQAIAMRPQKTSARTFTTSTSTPRALEDMIMRRNSIGANNQRLLDALKGRETWNYNLGAGLANLAPVQGYGDWGVNALRAFGGAMNRPTDAQIAREQAAQELAQKDLETALAYDKTMGETQTQQQVQEMGYTPMEYGTAGGTTPKDKQGGDSVAGVQASNFGRSVGYDPVENIPDYGPITRAALSEEQLGVGKYVPFSQSLAKGVSGDKAEKLQSTWSDISDNILSGRVLDFVGKAGGIRVADTPAEQEFIFGPIRNYSNMTPSQLRAGLKQARNNFVASGLAKARAQGFDVSENELKTWWNSAFSVPEGMSTNTMYNVQDKPKSAGASRGLIVGEVRNGVRFLGYNPDGSMKFERAQ
jgi:hypothetical protein